MRPERYPEFVIASELSDDARLKLEVIQSLIEPCDRHHRTLTLKMSKV